MLRYSKGKTDGMTVIMHFSTFSAVCSIPFTLGNFVVPNAKELMALVLIGLFGSLGQIALTYAYRLAPAGEVSIYNYSGILFSMVRILTPLKSSTVLIGFLEKVSRKPDSNQPMI